jgi:ABC-2 type transport system ATP-binding protein
MSDRPLARAVIIAALGLLALISAPRLHVSYTPRTPIPELVVRLSLRGAATGPIDVTDRWIVPIESAIRSLGDVSAARSNVYGDGAILRVRFRSGTDVEVKAARLSSELVPLRAKLPGGSVLAVFPATQAGASPVLVAALTDPRAAERAERIADEIRTAAGVRDVEIFGSSNEETQIHLLRGAPDALTAAATRIAIEQTLAAHPVATARLGDRYVDVIGGPAAISIRDVPLRAGNTVVSLESVARVEAKRAEPFALARLNGRPATLIAIHKDEAASLFDVESSALAKLSGVPHVVVWSEADGMRSLLRYAAIGLSVLALLLWVSGRRSSLVPYPAVALAIAINASQLVNQPIDATAVVAGMIAICAVAPLARLRAADEKSDLWPAVVAATFVLLVPIAVTFATGSRRPVFALPARCFVIAGLSSIVAAWMTVPPSRRVRPPHGGASIVRRALHGSASILLAVAAIACALFAWFGQRLDPRTQRAADPTRLQISLVLSTGTTLDQTVNAVMRVERVLARFRQIERYWSMVRPARADVSVEMTPEIRRGNAADLFRLQLGAAMPYGSGMLTVTDAGGSRGNDGGDFEDRPYTDEDALTYRVLLKSVDVQTLDRASEEIANRLARTGVTRPLLSVEGAAPAARIALIPRPGTSLQQAREAAAALRERTLAPEMWKLPDGQSARVVAPGAPATDADVPRRAEGFGLPIGGTTIERLFLEKNEFIAGGVQRELGRFVLPVTIRVPGFVGEKLNKRREIDRTLALFPTGSDLTIERPAIEKWQFSAEKLRLFALIGLIPALLVIAAAIILGSMSQAIGSIAVCSASVAFAAPVLMIVSEDVDELTLLAIGCALCCAAAIAVIVMARAANDIAATYRTARRFTWPLVAAAVAAFIALLVVSGSPAAVRDGWRGPLLAAATVSIAGIASAAFAGPAIVLLAHDVRRKRAAARTTRHPAAWKEPGPPSITVRNLTKRYASGFRALRRVSCDLAPGVIGLLGPNGAGKTTLLRIMTGLLLPTRGQVLYRGVAIDPSNLPDYRTRIGFLPQEFNAYAGLTAIDFLEYWAVERGIRDPRQRRAIAERLLAIAGLDEVAGRKVRDFSGGMRQRIGIARALIGDPPVLVVDEPTTGLDIESRNRFRDLIVSLAADRIIILSTHIAGDVEATASRILLLVGGELRWDGAPEALLLRAEGRVFEVVVSEKEARQLAREYRLTRRVRVPNGVRVRGVVPAGAPLPGPAAEPVLEEAYLAEVAGDRSVSRSGFAFLYEVG